MSHKKTIFYIFLLLLSNLYAQNTAVQSTSGSLESSGTAIGAINSISSFTRVDYARLIKPTNDPKIEGSVYAYHNWRNKGYFKVGKSLYKLSNLNFNMWNNTIEYKISNDSVYVFDLNNVDYAVINNRKYKSVNFDDKKRIFEIVFDGDEFSILKNYEMEIRLKDVDPLMIKKQKATYIKSITYFIQKNEAVTSFSLKKKNLLKLLEDKKDQVNKFVRDNRLSYRRERDIKKIFNYYKSLKS